MSLQSTWAKLRIPKDASFNDVHAAQLRSPCGCMLWRCACSKARMTQTNLTMGMIMEEYDEDQHKAKANTSTMMITRAKTKAMLEAEATRRWHVELCDGAWHVAMAMRRIYA